MFKLKLRDWLKATLLAVAVPVLNAVLESLNAGTLTLNWRRLGIIAASAFIAYIIKNFLTDDMKAAVKVIKSESDSDPVIIIPVDALPTTGARSTWYLYNDHYWYYDFTTNSFVDAGGERPTKPPHNA